MSQYQFCETKEDRRANVMELASKDPMSKLVQAVYEHSGLDYVDFVEELFIAKCRELNEFRDLVDQMLAKTA